jgi:polyisoprenyl-phosphate glycosyltransferase
MIDNPDISIIVPVYGSDVTLVPLYKRVAAAVSRIPATFELIFVDDCGPGNPWEIIVKMGQSDPRVIGLKLAKNFGQHIAITAGVDLARGRWLVIMDCDLQDRPEEIPRLWAKAQEGHDIVVGRRIKRQDGFFKRLFSRAFHSIFSYMTDQQSDAAQSNFGIYSRKVVDTVKTLFKHPSIFPFLVRWAGFEVVAIDVEHSRRIAGKSSYTLGRKLSLAIDIIVFYSNKPLKVCIHFSFLMAFTVFCYEAWLFSRYFLFDHTPVGKTGLTASLFLLSGFLLVVMGILGTYIYRVFNQVNGKSLYLVGNRTNVVEDDH